MVSLFCIQAKHPARHIIKQQRRQKTLGADADCWNVCRVHYGVSLAGSILPSDSTEGVTWRQQCLSASRASDTRLRQRRLIVLVLSQNSVLPLAAMQSY